jgi:outer membrane protein OmpA-like peptidoglycan-associated protein
MFAKFAKSAPILLAATLVAVPVTSAFAQTLKAYQNYDFVPGDKIVFEDDFRADTDGEFPAHWKLVAGQGVVNKVQDDPAFLLTDGNYAQVAPRVKGDAYLGDPFTIELDYFDKAGGYEKINIFVKTEDDQEKTIFVGYDVNTTGFENDLSASYPGDSEAFKDKWHHAALVFKGGQLKVYEDQFRVLVVPDTGSFKPKSLSIGGIGDKDSPLIFKNVRIATGGGMNLIDKLTKDGRIVTHGILFDVNQSTIKPQSMGALTQIVKMLKDNPAVKLEIGGHTDGDGDAAKNMTLSQARADAVKKALVDQGVDASRLTSKGYGASKPVDSNATPEGKANNRRVELTKAG